MDTIILNCSYIDVIITVLAIKEDKFVKKTISYSVDKLLNEPRKFRP